MAQKIKILIIDENNLHAHRLERILLEQNYIIKIATDALEGIYIIRLFKPHIIITEWDFKNIISKDFYNEIKKISENAIIIIHSNFPLENIEVEIRRNPNTSYINKADGFPLLLEEIRQALMGI